MKKYLYLLIGALFLSSCEDFLTVRIGHGGYGRELLEERECLDAANYGL